MKKEIDSDTSDKILGSQISSLRKDEIPPDTEIKSQIITNNLSELGQVNRISKIGQKFLKIPQQNHIFQIITEPQIVQDHHENEVQYIYQTFNQKPVIYQLSQNNEEYQENQGETEYYPNEDYQKMIINKIYQNTLNNSIFKNNQKKNRITRITKVVRTAPVDQINGARYVKNKKNIIIANKIKLENKNKQPKDSISKIVIHSSRNKFTKNNEKGNSSGKTYNNSLNNDFSESYFKVLAKKKLNNNSNIFKKQKPLDFTEIQRSKYEQYSPNSTFFTGKGMKTGEYKFMGGKTVLNHREFGKQKMILSKNIFNENNSKNINSKNEKKKLKFEVIDKFYTLTEYENKSIKRLGENQYKKYKPNAFKESNKSNSANHYGFEKNDYKAINSDNQKKIYKKLKEKTNETNIKYYNKNFEKNFKFNNSELIMDNFSKYLFEQINKIRSAPQSFIGLIEKAKDNIIKDKFGRIIYNGKIKIALSKGKPAFDEAIEFLQKTKSMEKLKFNHNITPKLPQNEDEISDKNDLKKKIEKMIGNGINIKSYWRDVIKDPEISFLLMIVDDNGVKSGKKRKDILNPHIKYIGISSVEINGKFVCYITLSSGNPKQS